MPPWDPWDTEKHDIKTGVQNEGWEMRTSSMPGREGVT